MSTLSLAVLNLPGVNTNDTWHAFSTRLTSSPARLIWCAVALGLVLAFVMTINKILAVIAGIGAFYVMWYLYNAFTATPSEQLFIGVGSPKSEWALWYTGGWSVLAMFIGVVAGVMVFVMLKESHDKRFHFPARVMAGIGTWGGVVLLYTLVFVEFHITHLVSTVYHGIANFIGNI